MQMTDKLVSLHKTNKLYFTKQLQYTLCGRQRTRYW